MIERAEFDGLVKNCLTNLHNRAILETHQLSTVFSKPPDYRDSQAEYLYELLKSAIQKLQPFHKEYTENSVEARPYLILRGRYVERLSLQKLQIRLSLSERQLRRENSQAIQVLTALLWKQALLCNDVTEETGQEEWEDNLDTTFEINREQLDIAEVIQGAVRMLQQRAECEETELCLAPSENLPYVLADRVILRQILLSLLNYAMDVRSGGNITIGAEMNNDRVMLWIQLYVNDLLSQATDEVMASLEITRYWAKRLDAAIQELHMLDEPAGLTQLLLLLPHVKQSVVLVVDDQRGIIRMFRRYLRRFNLQVAGIQDVDQVLPMARQLQPLVIILDVMMPKVDGWEILQMIRSDSEIGQTPIIICTVWDEPEMAFSLGATDFLKKPVMQQDLVDMLTRLNLLGMPVESSQ